MEENRKHERYREILEIKVIWPEKGTLIGSTRDFSDGGTFILVDFEPQPPVGTKVNLQLNAQVRGGEAPLLPARVARITSDGIGFEFIKE